MAESLGRPISSTTFTQCAAKATEVAEITQENGYYAVQGHWYRSNHWPQKLKIGHTTLTTPFTVFHLMANTFYDLPVCKI